MDVRQIFSFLLLFSGLAIADPTDASDVVVPDSPPIGKIASVTPLVEHGNGYNIYRIPAITCAPNRAGSVNIPAERYRYWLVMVVMEAPRQMRI